MNRKEKRQIYKLARGDPRALFCSACKCRVLPRAVKANDIDHYDILCAVCGERLGRYRDPTLHVNVNDIFDGRTIR